MAYPMESILEDISAEVANINIPTVLLAGELDEVDSIERHKTEVLAYLPNAEFKIIKGNRIYEGFHAQNRVVQIQTRKGSPHAMRNVPDHPFTLLVKIHRFNSIGGRMVPMLD
jgi:hypothetical protein